MELVTTISIGNLLTVFILILGFVAQWYDFKNRFDLLQQEFHLKVVEHEKDIAGIGKKSAIHEGKIVDIEKEIWKLKIGGEKNANKKSISSQ